MNSRPQRTPAWIAVVIILCMLPAAAFPTLLSLCPAGMPFIRTLLWIYPFYVLVGGWMAWLCRDERQFTMWVILIVMLLTHLAAWMLVLMPLE